MDSQITLEVHYGGKFGSVLGLCNLPTPKYIGGEVKCLYDTDVDLLSYFEVLGYLKDLGVMGDCQIYYKTPFKTVESGLKLLESDKDIPSLLNAAKDSGRLQIYVQQLTNGPHCLSADEVLQGLNRNACTETGQPSTENVFSEVGQPSNDHVFTEDVDLNDFDDDLSDVNSMEHVSDHDDEELDGVRRMLLDLRKDLNNITNSPSEDDEPDEPDETEAPSNCDQGDAVNVDENECRDSSDYETQDESEDDEGTGKPRQVRPKFPVYNPKMDMTKIEFEVGMGFSSPHELKEAVKSYAVGNMYQIKFKKNKTKLVLAVCMEGCPWRLYASWMQSEKSFQIKTLQPKHKCSRQTRIRLATASWLAKVYGDKIRQQPTWKCKDFKDDVLVKYKIKVSILQCYKAKKKALGEVEAGLMKHYALLKRYGKEVLKSDHRNTFKLSVHRDSPDDQPYFKRLYICFHALKQGWVKGCRPVIGLDGCFLKSYCSEELLSAVGRDANNQMYPIAWAIVEVESTDSWTWFIELLKDDLNLDYEGKGVTLITDQQKGLDGAIIDLLPRAEHRCCARHIYSNLRKSFTGSQLKNLFWKASKSSTQPEFEVVMNQIKVVCKEAHDWIRRHDPKLWCRGFFSTFSKCESVDNNMCECFNGTLVDARYKPIIDMLEDIRTSVIERMVKRRALIDKWEGEFCPIILKKLDESIDGHRYFCTVYNGNQMFEVKMGMDGYVVDLNRKTCSCNMWDLSGIPCSHAISAIYYMNDDPHKFIHESLKIEKCKFAYGECISPMNGQNVWPLDETEEILPPPQRRMPGRPQKARRKGQHEEKKQGATGFTVTRIGRSMKCNNCQQMGHNKKSCKNASVPVPTKEPYVRPSNATSTSRKRKTTTDNQQRRTSTRNDKRKDQVPNGFGIYIAPESGNTYYRSSGLPIQLNTEASSQMPTQTSQGTAESRMNSTLGTRSAAGATKTLGIRRKIIKK